MSGQSHQRYRSWLIDEGQAFAATLDGDPTTAVPTCPGWSVTDLVAHVGSYHRWVADLLRDACQLPRAPYALRPEPATTLTGWYEQCLLDLLDAVDATDPDTAMWTVTTRQRAGDWLPRQTHDLCIHRWDAQYARGHPLPILPHRATDLIDELFGATLPYTVPFLGRRLPDYSLSIQTIDGQYRRLATTIDSEMRFGNDQAPADAVLSGTASDLLLALWRRPSNATVNGNHAALAAWQDAVDS